MGELDLVKIFKPTERGESRIVWDELPGGGTDWTRGTRMKPTSFLRGLAESVFLGAFPGRETHEPGELRPVERARRT